MPEQRTALVDFLEFYLLNYFKPGLYRQTSTTQQGLATTRTDPQPSGSDHDLRPAAAYHEALRDQNCPRWESNPHDLAVNGF